MLGLHKVCRADQVLMMPREIGNSLVWYMFSAKVTI